jgi:hypothetical protein
LGDRKPYIQRLAGIGDANGKRIIKLKMARLALRQSRQTDQQEQGDSRNSAQHEFFLSAWLAFDSKGTSDRRFGGLPSSKAVEES